MGKKILVVDDEPDILDIISTNLKGAGYAVVLAREGATALALAPTEKPDLIVLDLMMPGMDGLEVCRVLKNSQRTAAIPILMATARGEEIDRVLGFELGADDYITKPFSVRELVLRVRAVLKRVGEGPKKETPLLEAEEVRLDRDTHTVWVFGQKADLTLIEFRLLETFLANPGRVWSRDQLLDKVWGYSSDVYSRTVDTHIQRLRNKLGKANSLIETIRGVGYKLKEKSLRGED